MLRAVLNFKPKPGIKQASPQINQTNRPGIAQREAALEVE
jgi:hypothetical protein